MSSPQVVLRNLGGDAPVELQNMIDDAVRVIFDSLGGLSSNNKMTKAQVRDLMGDVEHVLVDIDSIAPPKSMRLPVVLKPLPGTASMGVRIVRFEREWTQTLDSIKHELDGTLFDPASAKYSRQLLCETYIDGKQYAVDVLVRGEGGMEAKIIAVAWNKLRHSRDTSDAFYLLEESPSVIDVLQQGVKDIHEYSYRFAIPRGLH